MITYTYMVTNTGNVTVLGPFTVTDDKVTVTCPPVGAARARCVAHVHGDAHGDAGGPRRGRSSNVASASNGVVTSPPDTVTVDAISGRR